MKLQTRLILTFLIGLITVLTIAQVIQYSVVTSRFEESTAQSLSLVTAMMEENASNIFLSVQNALADSLQRGEMEKFKRLMKEQSRIRGLKEFTLFDPAGNFYASSLENPQAKAMPQDVIPELEKREDLTLLRHSGDNIEIFCAEKVTGDCLRCHLNWDRDGHGGFTQLIFSKGALLEMSTTLKNTLDRIHTDTYRNSILFILGIVIVLTPLAIIYIRRAMVVRLDNLGNRIKGISEGDLSKRIPVPEQLDEISIIAKYVNTMADSLTNTAKSVGMQADAMENCVTSFQNAESHLIASSDRSSELSRNAVDENDRLCAAVGHAKQRVEQGTENVDSIAAAMEQLSGNVNRIASSATQVNAGVTSMAAASEEMTANIRQVGGSLGQVNEEVSSIAGAVKELNLSLRNVRELCLNANNQSTEADGRATTAMQVMEKLSDSAKDIGGVVKLINNIADQTNMLALNASIEAASAGEAGKGFAVVANEVKELARQTMAATQMISERIDEIQKNSQDASVSAQMIVELIHAINKVSDQITQAVDQQSEMTGRVEMSMNGVTTASSGVTRLVSELQIAAEEVARSAMESEQGTNEIARSTTEIAGLSDNVLQQCVGARGFMKEACTEIDTTEKTSQLVRGELQESCGLFEEMNKKIRALGELGAIMQTSCDQLQRAKLELDRVTSSGAKR